MVQVGRGQRGQAIVLIALVITALCGMLGLAIDGGRAFADRREIQNAADAAAGAGAANFVRSESFTQAEQAMLDSYSTNRGLTGGSCSPVFSGPGAGATVSFDCTFGSDSSEGLTIAVQDFQPPASFDQFTATGRHSLLTEIIQVLQGTSAVAVGASGCSATWNTTSCSPLPPVVLATNGSCGSGGDAAALTSGGTGAGVVGNVVSYGDVTANGTPGIAGDMSWACGGTPYTSLYCYPGGDALSQDGCPGEYATRSIPTGKPPPYNLPSASCTGGCTAQSTSGLAVNLSGGAFTALGLGGGSASVNFGGSLAPYTNPCYFLAGGVYDFSGQTNVAGGVFSNDLRPPDEPDQTSANHTGIKTPQFWNLNGAQCAGSFQVTGVTDLPSGSHPFPDPLPTGSYAFRLTSVRQDMSVTRESAASACKTLTLGAPSGLNLNISNVPGAQAYNVYVSSSLLSLAAGDGDPRPGTCASQDFYWLAQIATQGYVTETNANESGCPSFTSTPNCSLGVTTIAANPLDLCQVDETEVNLGDLDESKLPTGCPPPSTPAIPEPQAVSCAASSYTNVAAGTQGLAASFQVAASCSWPGPMHLVELLVPVGGTQLPDQDPAVGYETANWGFCARSSDNKVLPCPNNYSAGPPAQLTYTPGVDFTPGAVQLQADSTGCFSFQDPNVSGNHGLPFVFSGYQYAWTALVQGGTCTDNLNPAVGGELIGHVYGPAATVDVTGTSPYLPYQGPQPPTVYGCVIGNQVAVSAPSVGGTSALAVYFVTPTRTLLISGYGIPTGSGC